jgi:molybdopterin-guanine dinucleotide biosynthesis protein
MAMILVGGQAKNVGKTTLVCNIIAALPQLRWNAIKITTHRHEAIGCELRIEGTSWLVWEQISAASQSDTIRFLGAGAEKAFLIQAESAALEEAYASLRSFLTPDSHVIVESTRAASILHPDLFLLLVNRGQIDFKSSAQQQLGNADVLLCRGEQKPTPDFLPKALQHKPIFRSMSSSVEPGLVSLISDVVDAS